MDESHAESAARAFKKLYEIIKILRSPEGCPWDREQTAKTLRGDLLEEAYECIEAVNSGDQANLSEELGDLYLLATMIAYISEQENKFSVADVLEEVGTKLIRRHPHVFANSIVTGVDQVIEQWETIKRDVEGKDGGGSILGTVPKSLPPLEKAYRYQKKAAKVGFDWKETSAVMEKLLEEIDELQRLDPHADPEAVEDELGDILFAAVNLCRHHKVDPTVALHSANSKFANRFSYIEKAFQRTGKNLCKDEFDLMDKLWNEAKSREK